MTTQQYRATNFRADSLERIRRINAILDEYDGQRLTARQVYYQFVARGWLENTPRSYQNLTSLLTDARYAGLVSWSAIEDRGREPDSPSEWNSIGEIARAAARGFRLPRWRGQDHYVELWVEKQALAGVLEPIASRNHVTLMVNKGYSSASAMKAAADRIIDACGWQIEIVCDHCGAFADDQCDGRCGACEGKVSPIARRTDDGDVLPIVLYLGDHDPSGEDMVRDIRDRLVEFGCDGIDVRKLALTMAQIRTFNPPPNPAKITDSRAAGYIARHGDQSWELDALPPRELNRLVQAAISEIVDAEKMALVIVEEDRQRATLESLLVVAEAIDAKPRRSPRKRNPRRTR